MNQGLSDERLKAASPAVKQVIEAARARVMQPVTRNSFDAVTAVKIMKARAARKSTKGGLNALAFV